MRFQIRPAWEADEALSAHELVVDLVGALAGAPPWAEDECQADRCSRVELVGFV